LPEKCSHCAAHYAPAWKWRKSKGFPGQKIGAKFVQKKFEKALTLLRDLHKTGAVSFRKQQNDHAYEATTKYSFESR
jgi:hypothetical protein